MQVLLGELLRDSLNELVLMADCMPKRWASFIREGPMEDARNYGTRRRPPSKNKFAGPP